MFKRPPISHYTDHFQSVSLSFGLGFPMGPNPSSHFLCFSALTALSPPCTLSRWRSSSCRFSRCVPMRGIPRNSPIPFCSRTPTRSERRCTTARSAEHCATNSNLPLLHHPPPPLSVAGDLRRTPPNSHDQPALLSVRMRRRRKVPESRWSDPKAKNKQIQKGIRFREGGHDLGFGVLMGLTCRACPLTILLLMSISLFRW